LILFSCIIALGVAGGLLRAGSKSIEGILKYGGKALSTSGRNLNLPQTMWDLGFGTVSASSLISHVTGGSGLGYVISNTLLANLPQGLFSLLYLFYNGIFTSMVAADEWSRFAHHRKTLRVSSPVGKQRSTYYLQLPYKFGLPLVAISIAFHWLISQSIFLARVDIYDFDGNYAPEMSISTCGYSCIALLFVVTVGSFVVVVFGVGSGFRKFPAGLPLAVGCSAVISAACHSLNNDADAALLPLKWGVVKEAEPAQSEEIRWCLWQCLCCKARKHVRVTVPLAVVRSLSQRVVTSTLE
jgi:hypothetical protein